jgi:triosephosphate isomerase
LVATKTRAAIDAGLKVILCIGETLEQRELEQTSQVCEAQLKVVVDVTKEVDWRYVLKFACNKTIPSLIRLFSATS